jgi:hypothetical protein
LADEYRPSAKASVIRADFVQPNVSKKTMDKLRGRSWLDARYPNYPYLP